MTWRYTDPQGKTWAIAIPMLPGETFEAWLARTAPIVRDALRLEPAQDLGPVEWAELLRRNGIAQAPVGSGSSTGKRSKGTRRP